MKKCKGIGNKYWWVGCGRECYPELDVCFSHASKTTIEAAETIRRRRILSHLRWAMKHLKPIDRGMRKRYDQITALLETLDKE